jgi:hypothetical protein
MKDFATTADRRCLDREIRDARPVRIETADRRPRRDPAARRPALRGQGQHRRGRRAHHRRLPGLRLPPDGHATVVQRCSKPVRAAGKTNLDQFACGLNGTRSPYGAVPNAFDARYVSGGSSSGSAYVVATGEVDFALGTDTAGSGPRAGRAQQHRRPQALQGPAQRLRRGARRAERRLRVDLRAHRRHGRRVLLAAMGTTRGPVLARLAMADRAAARALRFGVPDTLSFFGDAAPRQAFRGHRATARRPGRHAGHHRLRAARRSRRAAL